MALPQHIYSILQKRLGGQPVSTAEEEQLRQWYNTPGAPEALAGEQEWKDFYTFLHIDRNQASRDEVMQAFIEKAGFKDPGIPVVPASSEGLSRPEDATNLLRPVPRNPFINRRLFRWAVAVILIVGATTAIALVFGDRQPDNSGTHLSGNISPSNISPGINKAVLTIDDKQIDLSSGKTGIIVGNTISYIDGEQLADAGQFLTLSTPNGGQYQAVLPDGSRVWLNAASSIRFPSQFSAATRSIEITGEVYLEIARNSKKPFAVTANGMKIDVLGTRFNVNAYGDQNALTTTLIEGSVRVSVSGSDPVMLKPGYQAVIVSSDRQPPALSPSKNSNAIIVQSANVEQAIAWKNGLFNFKDVPLSSMLRQLERWYDIDIDFSGKSDDMMMNGEMDRGVQLSDVIRFLQSYDLYTKLDGRKLTISRR